MSLGRRGRDEQQELWISTTDLPKSEGHVFYRKLNALLAEAGFDTFVEELCQPYYHKRQGRPSIPPGVYFRMLLVGFYEGLGSQRGIAWRCGDSLSLRSFLGVGLNEDTPHHSSLTRVRDRLPLEAHTAVFEFVLQLADEKGLLRGKTVAADSTTLEADAAMKSIVRRDTGEDWEEYIRGLMKQEGIENPTKEEMRRFDKKRQGKKVSNEDWVSSSDSDSRITRMKDGRTHLAYKAENVIDLETELILAASIRHADESDTQTLADSVVEAQTHLNEAELEKHIEEVVADKGYHSTDQLKRCQWLGLRTYVPEPKSPHKRKLKKLDKKKRQALLNNRKRTKRRKSKELQRKRSERVERSFAHMCDTGGARRTWLHGLDKVQKRFLITAVARNLGLLMRKLFGMGTPRGLQTDGGHFHFLQLAWLYLGRYIRLQIDSWLPWITQKMPERWLSQPVRNSTLSTGC